MTAAPVAAGRRHRGKCCLILVNFVLARLYCRCDAEFTSLPQPESKPDWRRRVGAIQSHKQPFSPRKVPHVKRSIAAARTTALLALALMTCSAAAGAQNLRRSTIWDLKLGEPIAAQPSPNEFRAFACGSNGGAPRAPLTGWSDFARCRAEPSGLHEVYFEYDDELEYIARARDLEREITRWFGTTEAGFPIITSALFDANGVLKGIRLVTDSRPEHRNDITEANVRKRADAYMFGGIMAPRYEIDPARDCTTLPPAEGESPVGDIFIKQACERVSATGTRKVFLRVNFFRKPGQSGVNPQLPTQLTEGQFDSSARVEIFVADK